MKVIGKTDEGFILSVGAEEIATLCGYYYNCGKGYKTPKIGDEVKAAKMFKYLWDLKRGQNELVQMANNLRTAATLIDTLPEPLTNVDVGPDTEEGGGDES